MMANHKTDVITHGKLGFQNTRKPTIHFHKILFNLCIAQPKTIKWTNVFFFCGITFKIRSKLPLLWFLDHTQLQYTHEWLAFFAQVTSLLQRPLLSQHKTKKQISIHVLSRIWVCNSKIERLQTYALNSTATRIGTNVS
jgi:hypothetical protein